MPSSSPAFGLIDLLGTAAATIFIVATLLFVDPWPLRGLCLAGGVLGTAIGWALARRRTWEYRLLLIPGGAVAGLVVGGVLGTYGGLFATPPA
jgi:hypothetical protein